MKRKAILLCVLVFLATLSAATQYSWNQPTVTSGVHPWQLDISPDENSYFTRLDQGRVSRNSLASWDVFKESWVRLFRQQDTSTFYHTSNAEKTPYQFYSQLFVGYEYTKPTDEDALTMPHYGATFAGTLGHKLSFYADMWKGHYSGNPWYAYYNSPIIDSWVQFNDARTEVYVDRVRARIQYASELGRYAVGRGKYEIGSNIGGSIILSNVSNDYGYFSANWEIGDFTVKFLHATLIPDSTETDMEKDFADKHLATHIIQWDPSPAWMFFVGEHVIYGNRGIDASYLLPHTFLRITEHNQGDRDNMFIFAGGELCYGKANTLYGNVIVDEFSSSDLGTDSWMNKYAIQVGNALQLGKSRICTEFTGVRPWIYTHKFMIGKFSYDDAPLGFPLGSNLIQYALELNQPLPFNTSLDIQASYTRQGSLGNDFTLNYESRPSDSAPWLAGTITNTTRLKAVLTLQPLSHHTLRLGFTYTDDESDAVQELIAGYQVRY